MTCLLFLFISLRLRVGTGPLLACQSLWALSRWLRIVEIANLSEGDSGNRLLYRR